MGGMIAGLIVLTLAGSALTRWEMQHPPEITWNSAGNADGGMHAAPVGPPRPKRERRATSG